AVVGGRRCGRRVGFGFVHGSAHVHGGVIAAQAIAARDNYGIADAHTVEDLDHAVLARTDNHIGTNRFLIGDDIDVAAAALDDQRLFRHEHGILALIEH